MLLSKLLDMPDHLPREAESPTGIPRMGLKVFGERHLGLKVDFLKKFTFRCRASKRSFFDTGLRTSVHSSHVFNQRCWLLSL